MVIGFDIHTNDTPIGTLHRNTQQSIAAIIICDGKGMNEQNKPMNTALAVLFLLRWKRWLFCSKCRMGFSAGFSEMLLASGKYLLNSLLSKFSTFRHTKKNLTFYAVAWISWVCPHLISHHEVNSNNFKRILLWEQISSQTKWRMHCPMRSLWQSV